LPLVLGIVALALMVGGIALIALKSSASTSEFLLLPAGLSVLACSFFHWRAAWAAWHRGGSWRAWLGSIDGSFCRRTCIGVIGCYLAALVIGPVPYIALAMLAAIACWLTFLCLPRNTASSHWERWTNWSRRPGMRPFEYVALAVLFIPLAGELGLQGAKLARTKRWIVSGDATATESQGAIVPLAHDSLARHGVAPLPAGPLRVALLDADSCEGGRNQQDYQAQLERTLPGVKLVPVDLSVPWSSASPDELAEQLASERVDLVLAMLPVCGELTRERPASSWFDWRQFELARVAGYPVEAIEIHARKQSRDYESFCGKLSPQLAACRTPIDDRMHERWRETFEHVDALSEACSARELSLAVVLVPGEFQVNNALRDTLARRAGYASEQIDVELPQRKLAGYAAERRLPLVDLLPTLRVCRESPFARHAEQFSEAGHRATAAALSGWLESRYGGQLAATSRLTSAP
jgi:hypothetical protein